MDMTPSILKRCRSQRYQHKIACETLVRLVDALDPMELEANASP